MTAAKGAPDRARARAQSGGLVLVVEADTEMNRFICESLHPEHRVAMALDGRRGVSNALSLRPDVMLASLAMPDLPGEELVRAVRAERELDGTSLVLLTTRADDERRVRLLRAGAQDYLTKPFAVEELHARIGNLISGRRALEAEARLASLVEQAPDGIFVADLDGRYTEVNAAGCRMLGFSREELIGKTIHELLSPEDLERLSRSKALMLQGRAHVAEWALRRKDGTHLPVEVSARILPDGRWQGFVRDISERKRAERELRLAEAKSSGLLSISADAIIVIDADQRITMFNEGAEKIFGYSKAEVIGCRLEKLIPERFRANHPRHVERFAASPGASRRMDAAIFGLRKNGEEFPADAVISKLEVGGAQILSVALRDVTKQKRIEREQRFLAELGPVLGSTLDYEETLSTIAQLAVRELADYCIVDIVEEHGEVRRLKVASRDPAMAWACDVLTNVRVAPPTPHLLGTAIETKRPVLVAELRPEELELYSRGEEHLQALRAIGPRSAIAVPLLAREKALGAIALVSSSAARTYGQADVDLAMELAHRAAIAVENAQLYLAARRASQVRDDVLGIVAHDLRNPLGAILLQAQRLRRPEVDPRRPADAIDRAATRMNRLIRDLLDVTQMEAGRLTIEQERLPTAQILSEVFQGQRPLATSASVELRLDVEEALGDVWADRDRLLQVFGNLVDNALRHTKPGGCITVSARPGEGEVRFSVADTGSGIAPEHQPHLFDRFWQARRVSRRGTGLGLPIVKGIVESHRGRVWVESTLGKGSTFFFTIPTAEHDEDEPGG